MSDRRGRHERTIYPETRQILGQLALFELSPWEELQVIILAARADINAMPEAQREELKAGFDRAEEEARDILATNHW